MYIWSEHCVCVCACIYIWFCILFPSQQVLMALLELSLFGVAPLLHSMIPKITFVNKPVLTSYFHYSRD